ncbi:MAG: hypothetical protein H7842_15675, partial [Gammaproteobacteria bacterium SHHR-1]
TLADITSAKVVSDMQLLIVLANGPTLENTLDYGDTGGQDDLEIQAGLTQDLAGNLSTTDQNLTTSLTII